nr:MAG TPA: hypothetical protein [Caudoviricetes sp.]
MIIIVKLNLSIIPFKKIIIKFCSSKIFIPVINKYGSFFK